MNLFEGIKTGWNNLTDGIFNYNGMPQTYDTLMGSYNSLGSQLVDLDSRGIDTSEIMSNMDKISAQLTNLEDAAKYFGISDPSQLSAAQIAQYNNFVNQNTGVTGFVNNNFGGWGNVLSGLQGLGNLYFGYQNLGLMKDQLGIQQSALDNTIASTRANFNAMKQTINNSIDDRIRARKYTEEGTTEGYEKDAEKYKVKATL